MSIKENFIKFDSAPMPPLADRMRPQTIDEIVGQNNCWVKMG